MKIENVGLSYHGSRILENYYGVPYQADGKPVVKIGIAFSKETKTVSDWKIEH